MLLSMEFSAARMCRNVKYIDIPKGSPKRNAQVPMLFQSIALSRISLKGLY